MGACRGSQINEGELRSWTGGNAFAICVGAGCRLPDDDGVQARA